MSDSDSEDDEEIIIDTDDLPTDSRTLVSNGNLSKRNGINRTNTNPEIRAWITLDTKYDILPIFYCDNMSNCW